MHSYLRAIGFGDSISTEHDMEQLLSDIFHSYERHGAVKIEDGRRAFIEMAKSFGPEIGIKLCGELDEHGFHRQYYFPYLNGSGVTTTEDLTVEKKVNGDSYSGICDDGRVGVSLIFFLQNPADYRRESFVNHLKGNKVTTTFSGLSLDGMILLPLKKDDAQKEEQKKYFSDRNSLILAAKNGNQEAIESLTLEDMDIYSMLSRRVLYEDVFSIVDTFFMPYGMECDQYQVMGTINFYTKVYNSYTKEVLYQMNIECNGMTFDICINKKDLLGEPEVGRRFKGTIWLQGKINFSV